MASIALSPAARERAWRRAQASELPFHLAAGVFCLFLVRDSLTGALRYGMSLTGLSSLWFVPDLLTFVAAGWFAWTFAWQRRSPWAVLLVLMTAIGLVMGWLVLESSPFALFSSLKLFLPLILGCCFAGRSLIDLAPVRWCMAAVLALSVVGLILNPYVDYPWTAASIDNFGYAKETGRVWWAGEDMRYGGFSGEATIAAFTCTFLYIMAHVRWPRWLVIAAFVPIFYAVELSTSKTCTAILALFACYYLVSMLPWLRERTVGLPRQMAQASFLLVPVPFLLMVVLIGVDLSAISDNLFSLQDRINNTWRFPFTWMAQHFPPGLVLGCGIGCFTYPMMYTAKAALWVPVDSFYVTTYVMLGILFVPFIVGMFTATLKTTRPDKLLVLAFMNIFLVTIQGYGPSIMAITLFYAASDMFLEARTSWRRLAPTVAA